MRPSSPISRAAKLAASRASIFTGFAALLLSACGSASAPSASSTPVQTPSSAITVSISPSAGDVPTGGSLVFTATVSGAGGASSAITWSVDGITGGNIIVGTIVSTASSAPNTTALYTAPLVVPSPAAVTVTATSVANPSKSASATVTVACAIANSISPAPVSVALGQTQIFTAGFCGLGNATVSWDLNGTANGSSTLGTITAVSANSALYTAPVELPATNPITVHASANPGAGPPVIVSATITVVSAVAISISPPSATLATSQRTQFTATVSNTSDTAVAWFVNGLANGNASIGQICQPRSNPCVAPLVPSRGTVDYLAPASVPASNPLSLTAVSQADSSRSASATISVVASSGSISLSISPAYAFLAPSNGSPSTQQFSATVTGTANTAVTWSIQSAVSGSGCAGAACGSISASGLYAAPGLVPSPNAISVIATSQADPTQSALATVALTSGPVVETLLPSGVMAGAVQGFPLSIRGANFAAGSSGSGSTILIAGAARATTCATTTTCTIALTPADVQTAGTLMLQLQNPGAPGALSNPVPFVIVPFDVSQGVIALTGTEPVASGQRVTVVEPTTAASSSSLSVESVGYLTGGNSCGIQGSPLAVTRPSSGSAVTSVCIYGAGLDPSFSYAFTAPESSPNDIGVTAAAITGLLPNMIELDLQISSATIPGVRSLFITNLNNDRAVASGVLEIQ
jgi:hypothetical protein